jgi:hypothetical protein
VTTDDYAQHFTPVQAVDLAYGLIDELYGPLRSPRLIDPACGEGAFLFRALERGLTSPDSAFGIERDPELACRVFGRANGPRAAAADALTGLAAPLTPGAFDLVVANPPYGTGAAGLRGMGESDARRLAEAYALWALPRGSRGPVAIERLRSYPAEVLFLELCVSLARSGGHVAVILPEGIAANARYAAVRKWLLAHVQLDAVIGLPKSTFRRTGAAAKTILLLLTRRPPPKGHRVRMGEVGEWPSPVAVGARTPSSAAVAGGGPLTYATAAATTSGPPPASPADEGVRAPTARRLALAFSADRLQSDPRLLDRLDPAYWHPSFDALLDACRLPLAPLGDFITDLTYGPIVTGRAQGAEDTGLSDGPRGIMPCVGAPFMAPNHVGARFIAPAVRRAVAIVNQGQVGFCGVDLTEAPCVPPDSPWVSRRSMLRPGDVVLPRSGEGSLGKHRVAVFLADQPAGVGSFVDLIRLQGLNPFYLAAFLKSTLGRSQVSRAANGVGVPNISFDEIRRLLVPALPQQAQQAIEARYRREVLPLHRQAVKRHASLRAQRDDPRTDRELRELRKAGERQWGEVIGELDARLLVPNA